MEVGAPAGIYVHVPFCLTRCGYCDFNAYAGLDHLAPRYLRALVAEASLAAPAWDGIDGRERLPRRRHAHDADPGGPRDRCSRTSASVFEVDADAEITTEANPDTVDEASLAALLEAGYDRLSMGAQSFDPAVLAALERHPSAGVRPRGVRRRAPRPATRT